MNTKRIVRIEDYAVYRHAQGAQLLLLPTVDSFSILEMAENGRLVSIPESRK